MRVEKTEQREENRDKLEEIKILGVRLVRDQSILQSEGIKTRLKSFNRKKVFNPKVHQRVH